MHKPTILITGGNGQVAWDLKQQAQALGHVVAPSKAELDITEPGSLAAVISQTKPDLIINAAAYTAVDKAEQEIDKAMQVNVVGPSLLAEACTAQQIPLIHISTDYIFDGQKNAAYTEDEPANPVSVYGESKWQGEQAVRNHCANHIILRVSGVFGFHGHNFVKTILRLAQEQEELRIVADQITCPTPAADIASAIVAIAGQAFINRDIAWGTYHYCSTPPVSWYDFTRAIIASANDRLPLQVKTLTPVITAEFPRPAKRPPYSVLAAEKIKQHFNLHPKPWQEGIDNLIDMLANPNSIKLK